MKLQYILQYCTALFIQFQHNLTTGCPIIHWIGIISIFLKLLIFSPNQITVLTFIK